MIRSLLTMLTILFCVQVHAQTKNISGTVLDDTEATLFGVTVMLQDTKTVTQTDANGKFTINVPEEGNAQLVFSYTGYKAQTAAATNGMTITMVKNILSEEDVVIVVDYGYGTIKKSDMTGSVATL